jgi:hypothetical protein
MPNKLQDVCEWMMMSRDRVLDKFYNIPGAFSDGEGQQRFVYVPGTRPDRVLIVAHADTVWNNLKIGLETIDGIVRSTNQKTEYKIKYRYSDTEVTKSGYGIGADDRAGCCIAWRLKDLGHSILITSGEEIGCIATKRLMEHEWWENELNEKHNFAVQFDRRGHQDIVFYDLATDAFAEYVEKSTGYVPADGSTTDIRHICKKICGVNISVGYLDEHNPTERLVLANFENTASVALKWLSQDKLPRFDAPQNYMQKFHVRWKPPTTTHSLPPLPNTEKKSQEGNENNQKTGNEKFAGKASEAATDLLSGKNSGKKSTTFLVTPYGLVPKKEPETPSRVIEKVNAYGSNDARQTIVCRSLNCDNVMTIAEWQENTFRCKKCKTLH